MRIGVFHPANAPRPPGIDGAPPLRWLGCSR